MLYFHMTEGRIDAACELSTGDHHQISQTQQWLPPNRHPKALELAMKSGSATGWFCRNEIGSMNDAKTIANDLNIASMTPGHAPLKYIAVDNGSSVSPRYDVIEAPQLGDEVSRYFNGDAYPAGKIIKISDSLRRIETDDGTVFWRRQEAGRWINNGTWSMAKGHRNDRNPHF